MLTRALAGLLLGGVLTTALPDPIKVHTDVEYSPYAFYSTNQVPIGAADYANAVEEHVDIADEHSKPGDKTIYQILNTVPHFSKLAKVVNISDEIVSLLNDTSAGVTFFAVPDWALKRPGHRHPHGPHRGETREKALEFADEDKPYDLLELVSAVEDIEESFDEPDKERRRKFIKKIVTAILAYHILPEGLDSQQLAQNLTFATNLTLPHGSPDRKPLRLRVQKIMLPPKLNVNLYSEVVKADIKAKNGIIHVINHPLLPPPSVFQELFILPSAFSFSTSGLQRVGLTNALDWRYVPGKDKERGSLEGTPVVTFFAPTNRAFMRLPRGLRLFLFSPFGERVLKKLLEFHIVPGLVVHSDYFYNSSSDLTESPFSFLQVPQNQDLPELEQSYLESFISERSWIDDDFESIDHGGNWACEDDTEGDWVFHDFDCVEEPLDMCEDMEDEFAFGEDYSFLDSADSSNHLASLNCLDCTDLPHQSEDFPEDYLCPAPPSPGGHRHGSYPPPPAPGGPNHHFPHGPTSPPPPPPHRRQPHPHDPRRRMIPSPIYALNLTLPSLLANHSHFVQIKKYKFTLPIPGPKKPETYSTKVIVDGQHVALSDLVARNGAVHVIGHLLDPRPHQHNHEGADELHEEDMECGWEDWESWLPQWAADN